MRVETMEVVEENSSFGIQKIIDVRIGEDGKQMYKVKWEPTWEPVETLLTCQHLIDEFWSFVNIAKVNKENSKQVSRRLKINSTMNIGESFPRISEDDKSDVQRLIARTNSTTAGNPSLMAPNMIFNQQNQQTRNLFKNSPQGSNVVQEGIEEKPISFNLPYQTTCSFSPDEKSKITPKSEASFSLGKGKASNSAALKYIENFENPYVKIILVCKICNKEQNLKFAHDWKRHYLGHVSNEEKPHQCPHCPKAFVTLAQKRKHLKTHESTIHVKNEGIF